MHFILGETRKRIKSRTSDVTGFLFPEIDMVEFLETGDRIDDEDARIVFIMPVTQNLSFGAMSRRAKKKKHLAPLDDAGEFTMGKTRRS
jgi:hypothetical protein